MPAMPDKTREIIVIMYSNVGETFLNLNITYPSSQVNK